MTVNDLDEVQSQWKGGMELARDHQGYRQDPWKRIAMFSGGSMDRVVWWR